MQKVLLSLVLALTAIAVPEVLLAQPQEFRLDNVRWVTPKGPGRMKQVPGALILDSQAQRIRFVAKERRFIAKERSVFEIPTARVTTLHYESWNVPRRFIGRSSFYLTLYYLDAADRPAFETIRMLSSRDAEAALTALERASGRAPDRSRALQSFRGVPIRAGIGSSVVVTGESGEMMKGTIATLTESSLTLDSMNVPHVFDEARVRKIRLVYSPKHDALVGFTVGAAGGLFSVWLAAGLGGCFSTTGHTEPCHFGQVAAAVTAITGGVGSAVGMTIGALRYPFNKSFDVFETSGRGSSTRPGLWFEPQLGPDRKAVFVSVVF